MFQIYNKIRNQLVDWFDCNSENNQLLFARAVIKGGTQYVRKILENKNFEPTYLTMQNAIACHLHHVFGTCKRQKISA